MNSQKLRLQPISVLVVLVLVGIVGVITAVTPFTTPLAAEPTLNVSLADPFPSLSFEYPVDIAHADDNRLFVVQQKGKIRVVSLTTATELPLFLDLTSRVTFGSEMGLLGLVFHPDYTQNGYFYVNYTYRATPSDPLYSYVSRFQVSGDANVADANSEQVILRVEQPYTNHNGGDLAFGSDGYLYVGLGDGGDGGDPHNNGQTPSTLLGSMLRLDVDSNGTPDCGQGPSHYAIPADNPFVAAADNKCDEIWATGLRNPWRYSFDSQTDDLYIGDVGQGSWEEINFQPAHTSGFNYGWRCYEGNHPYNTAGCNPDTSVYTFPIDDYDHGNGRCAVTGGFVYRGAWYPELNGRYFYGDYCSGEIWSMETDQPGAFPKMLHLDTNYSISTFGEDAHGELYLAARGTNGRIYRLQDDTMAPVLHVQKAAPLTAVANQPFTYTLTVQNSSTVTLTNVTITDTLPSGATYISGGNLTDDIISWPVFNLAPYGQQSVQFSVSTTTTLINSDYRATADGGQAATGTAVVTFIEPVPRLYLPIIIRQ